MSSNETRGTSTQGIEAATGIAWDQWVSFLTSSGAADLPHKQIAALALEHMTATDHAPDNPEWWAQGVTVAYEQHIGRRLPGQRANGTFDASVSKTLPGTKDDAVEALAARFRDPTEINGVALVDAPSTSATEKWRYWRASLADGSRVQATVDDNGSCKARIGLQHGKLANSDDVATWKTFWRAELNAL